MSTETSEIPVTVHFRPTRPETPSASEHSTPATPTLRHRLQFGLREALHFVIVTSVIFFAIFFALNYSAYEKKASLYFENSNDTTSSRDLAAELLASSTKTLPTESEAVVESSTEKPAATAAELTSTALTGVEPEPSVALPHLNLRVTPPGNRVIIPQLGINAPIVETTNLDLTAPWQEIEQNIQNALRDGVVHIPGTATPGQTGNAFITGHSSYYPWDEGRYKDIFATLPSIELGDKIIVYYDQKKYIYEVSNLSEVKPRDVFVLGKTRDTRLTLMTCTPVGTTLRRLIVSAHLVDEK